MRVLLNLTADLAELLAILLFAGAVILLGIALSSEPTPSARVIAHGPIAYAEAE